MKSTSCAIIALTSGLFLVVDPNVVANPPLFEHGVREILAAKCLECHGADKSKRRSELDLRSAQTILQGGESGPAVVPGKPDDSLLWEMIETEAMPPRGGVPLTREERGLIHAWIAAGAGSTEESQHSDAFTQEERNFWSFRSLARPSLPTVAFGDSATSPIDRFVVSRLEEKGLTFAPEADRRTLCRRVYLDLIGLPPSIDEVESFVHDTQPDAYLRLVDTLLASPHYGERWGRQWLDVVGYADSNGYIRHDTPRPHAWRYRDYVIDSLNSDVPYDQFWIEQLAGDELVKYPAPQLSDEDRRRLTATHFLRNAPDGTDTTEGNEITRVMERYAVLEAQLQITMSSMFGMTIDCARCHSHKFDPIPHRDYYALQAIFYPAFNVKNWVQPKDRWIYAAGENDITAWKTETELADREIAALRLDYEAWLLESGPPQAAEWRDDFSARSLHTNWSATISSENRLAETPKLHLDSQELPAAYAEDGELVLKPAASGNSTSLVTQRSFDWTPDAPGEWIQVTFDLIRSNGPDGRPAERVGYYVALQNHDGSGATTGGNILVDGDPAGGASVFLDYPGSGGGSHGSIGIASYVPGRNFGVKITRVANDELLMHHLVDGVAEINSLRFKPEQLRDGGFGFELCCSRSFTADNVVVSWSQNADATDPDVAASEFSERLAARQVKLENDIASVKARHAAEPEKLAWVTDLPAESSSVHILKRGDYFDPGPEVEPGPLSVLVEPDNTMSIEPRSADARTTGRRLAFSQWATRPDSRAAALLARVHVDRLWRGHFGTGLVLTPENFGASGVQPANPELLEYLATQLVSNGWRQKEIHRQIVLSRTFRQTTAVDDATAAIDSENLLFSRFPAHRLDAEQIRDAILSVSGLLDLKMGGPPVEFVERSNREIVLPPNYDDGPHPSDRRSLYIRYRRSQPLTFLQVFDEAAPDPNCLSRATSTVVAQSLTLLNGPLSVRAARQFAQRLIDREGATTQDRILHAFELALSRKPSPLELIQCTQFLEAQEQQMQAENGPRASLLALAEFCKVLLASNEFLQLQ